MYVTECHSPVGIAVLASDGKHLTGLWLAGQKYFAQPYGEAVITNTNNRIDLPVFNEVRAWLDRYFAGGKPDIAALPLAPAGSAFRQSVWRILCEIPYGELCTYGAIAKQLGCKSAQAIGGAVGHNPISIIIPCHRVVGVSGALTGYAGGVDVKHQLLILEGAQIKSPA
ncbi:MAG: methylated-DNA--[protein]-cysteine S-methyltransferase [Defluviitaleaceae bacterium]|nr:methylated-DNA--[protein]-cysteine S-methyltransferase [Defluviitaleaceae bacterium]MCL2275997.1 methylated-DNA--[protein]-cysteine S-methyltransferase [Defluviitaleaceae bacterium]